MQKYFLPYFFWLLLLIAVRPSLSGSSCTTHTSFNIMVSPFSAVNCGQCGNDGQLGSPVRAKLNSASAIFADSSRGLAPPPEWLAIRSVLRNQKEISRQ